ncbi:hypothetical protein FNV43_RR21550 [Rhamnella rubrinervis]|uniref:Uncharacterized protein n=1 Tax=Rhamnella rubrinervis TaxID=2594499 RepID=A0A8K0DWU3_9ROSA|nr:hypothetical protein FNV43_RR21550 [Rhamnella rubrinervis]
MGESLKQLFMKPTAATHTECSLFAETGRFSFGEGGIHTYLSWLTFVSCLCFRITACLAMVKPWLDVQVDLELAHLQSGDLTRLEALETHVVGVLDIDSAFQPSNGAENWPKQVYTQKPSNGAAMSKLSTSFPSPPQGTPESVYLWQRVNSQLSSPSQPYSLRDALSQAQSSRAGASAQALREPLHPILRQKLAATILVVLLCKHDFDAPYQKPDDKLYIVLLYFPLIGQVESYFSLSSASCLQLLYFSCWILENTLSTCLLRRNTGFDNLNAVEKREVLVVILQIVRNLDDASLAKAWLKLCQLRIAQTRLFYKPLIK